jgi:hypothetical protein
MHCDISVPLQDKEDAGAPRLSKMTLAVSMVKFVCVYPPIGGERFVTKLLPCAFGIRHPVAFHGGSNAGAAMKDTVLESYVNRFIDEQGLEELGFDDAFEHFVNYTLISKQYPRNFDFEEAAVGGGNDTGLDGCAVIVNGNFVTSPEEVTELAKRNGYLDVTFNFIQSKSTDKFKGDQVGTFLFGIKNLFDEKSSIPENDEIRNLRRIKDRIYELSIEFTRLPDLRLFYVTAGSWQDPEAIRGRANRELNQIKGRKIFRSDTIEFVDAERLKEVFRELQRRIVKEIRLEYQTPLPEMQGVVRSFLGALPATDFVGLLTDADGKLQKSLFYDNVRDFQGQNKVNQEIEVTLKDPQSQSRLALLNNGVTIIAKQIEQIGSKLKLSDYQIVNGCQTSNLIFDARDALLPTTYVPVKIIETVDQDIITEIIKATNRQTEVKLEAFESLSPFHKDLEEYYTARSKNVAYPIFYERRSKQYQNSVTVKPFQVISLATQIKAYVATFLRQPHSTHRYYGELLESYRDKLFVASHAPVGYYASALLAQRIHRLFEMRRVPAGRYKLLRYQIMLIIAERYVPTTALRGKDLEVQCEKLIAVLSNLAAVRNEFAIAQAIIDQALYEGRLPPDLAERSRDFTSSISLLVAKSRRH